MTIRQRIYRAFRQLGWDVHRVGRSEQGLYHVAKFLEGRGITVVFDVGANQGQFARGLRENGYQGRIVSFEPLSSTHRKLMAAAASDAGWTVAPRMALGDSDLEIRINIAGNDCSSSILPMAELHQDAFPVSAYVGSETTPCHRLENVASTFLSDGDRGCLKLDVQGYERQVLDGAAAMLARFQIVYLEVSFAELYKGQMLFTDMLSYMGSRGYQLWSLTPGSTDPRTGQMLQADALFYSGREE